MRIANHYSLVMGKLVQDPRQGDEILDLVALGKAQHQLERAQQIISDARAAYPALPEPGQPANLLHLAEANTFFDYERVSKHCDLSNLDCVFDTELKDDPRSSLVAGALKANIEHEKHGELDRLTFERRADGSQCLEVCHWGYEGTLQERHQYLLDPSLQRVAYFFEGA